MKRSCSRRFFLHTSAAAGALALSRRPLFAASANEQINIGLIGCGGRGGELSKMFAKLQGVTIAGLCDPDQSRVAELKKTYSKAQGWTDLRKMLDSPDIDAVVIATCNHWHALAAIWAMQADKDVYVEKPLANNHWEGQQVVAAAARHGRICQVGTQQRSDPMQREIKEFLHEKAELGKILSARVNRYGIREPIGKRTTPLAIPSDVDFDLWLGPASEQPILRDKLHYDWHWVWNTGSGEMGNWGVHVLDDLRNTVLQDKIAMPARVLGGGGRVAWNDAGETPNVQFAYFDADGLPVVMGLCNLPSAPGGKDSPDRPGPGSGYVAYCEGGRLEGQRGGATAFDKDGKKVRSFKGSGGNDLHQQNFIDAVRQRKPDMLASSAEVGLHSTGWCHLANIATMVGETLSRDTSAVIHEQHPLCNEVVGELHNVLTAHRIDVGGGAVRVSPLLEFDAVSERFVGEHAEAANKHLGREYRAGFEVPEIGSVARREARKS